MPRSMRRTAVETAHLRNVGGLARPRRDGAKARHDHDLGGGFAGASLRVFARSVGQQALEQRGFARIEIALEVDEVHEAGADGADAGMHGFERGAQFCDAEFGDCGGAGKLEHGGREFYLGSDPICLKSALAPFAGNGV